MTEAYPFEISGTILACIFTGVLVSHLLSETLGWRLSGIVVPGYLTPIFILRPLSGVTIVMESLLTCLLLGFLSRMAEGKRLLHPLFGRNRLIAIFISSILIRLLFEACLTDPVGGLLNRALPASRIDFRHGLSGHGLIIVALLANSFWDTGIRRGILPQGVNTGLTILITRFILVPYLGLSLSGMDLFFDDVVWSFSHSARPLMILLLGVVIASHFNINYGSAIPGLFVPALFSLSWVTPLRVLTTAVESLAIYLIGLAILQVRQISSLFFEKRRRLLLFIFTGFLVEILCEGLGPSLHRDFRNPSLWGFGYLLPFLLAEEMMENRSYLKVMGPLLQISLLTILSGTLISFLILKGGQAIFPRDGEGVAQMDEVIWTTGPESEGWDQGAERLLPLLRAFWRMERGMEEPSPPTSEKELLLFRRNMVIPLMKGEYGRAGEVPGFAVRRVKAPYSEEGHLALLPLNRGMGIYIFREEGWAPFVVEVPSPFNEPGTMEGGFALYELLRGRALFVNGREGPQEDSATPSFFLAAHSGIYHGEGTPPLIMEVRGRPGGAARMEQEMILSTGREVLHPDSLPSRVRGVLDSLEEEGFEPGIFDGSKGMAPFEGCSSSTCRYSESLLPEGFATLFLSPSARKGMRWKSDGRRYIDRVLERMVPSGEWGEAFTLLQGFRPLGEGCPEFPESWGRGLKRFEDRGDVIALQNSIRGVKSMGWRVVPAMDPPSGRRYLLLSKGASIKAINLEHPSGIRYRRVVPEEGDERRRAVETFLNFGRSAISLCIEGRGGR